MTRWVITASSQTAGEAEELSISDFRPDPPAGGCGIDPAPASSAQIIDLIKIRKSQIANRKSFDFKDFRLYGL